MKKHQIITVVLILALMFGIIIYITIQSQQEGDSAITTGAQSVTEQAIIAAPQPTDTIQVDPTEGVYTFLQGPKSWKEKRPWSGIWGKTFMDGGSFGGFGCGLCCMANIYSTLTEYKCSPVDMYKYAQKNTGYWSGAIEWSFMKDGMESLGFASELRKKPDSYEEFQSIVASSRACVMLVSSNEDDSYWQDTPGHYVTTFLYDAQTDKIFLGDSGNPDHNRQWVKLRKIYKALKTASGYQFMTVTEYDTTKNKWKRNKITDKWVDPAELTYIAEE